MPNDSYFSRLFTKEYTAFINEVTPDLTLPDAKLLRSLTFRMIRSASSIVNHSARSSKSDGETIRVAEHRPADRLSTCDFSKVTARLESVASRLRYGDGVIVFDESDIQKPYRKSFEALDLVQDGIHEGEAGGQGVPRRRHRRHRREEDPHPAQALPLFGQSKGFESVLRRDQGVSAEGSGEGNLGRQ